MINQTKIGVKIPMKRPSRVSGIGIVEVLVALVVVSFGVLGMASLQLTGMKHSSGGFNRTKALLSAQSMATRIRINSDAAEEYDGFDSSTGFDCGAAPAPYCQTVGTTVAASCTTTELATFDTFTVACGDVGTAGAEKGVVGTLPNGVLSVTCDGTPCGATSAYEITVSWSEGRSRTNNDELITRRVQMRLRP